jgi:hypothetical protein
LISLAVFCCVNDVFADDFASPFGILDDWRFAKRMPSRASAVRELLKRGLAAEGFATAKNGSKSMDYGVVGSPKGGAKRSR